MSSLHKDPRGKSPFWYCAFTLADGRRAFRSTGKTKKTEAAIVCQYFADTEGIVRRGEATADILLKSANDALKRLGQDQIKRPSAAEYLRAWLKSQKGETSEAIIKRYGSTIEKFLKSLGPKADLRLSAITTGDVIKFRDELLATGRSAATVNGMILRLLKRPFSAALNTGVIDRSPINKDTVRPLKDVTTERKGIFSPEHVVRLIDAAEGDWKGLILAAYYTGQRLMDLSTLQWRAVDLDVQHAVYVTQRKTGTFVTVPLHPELEEYLTNCPSSDDPRSPVFPSLARKTTSGNGGLSTGFKEIMARANIDGGLIRERSGKAGRTLSALSFHSLRHSFNSALASANVSQEHRRQMTGHASDSMNSRYTHNQLETLRRAVASLPRLPKN